MRVLIVHSSAELYGSDRSLDTLVAELSSRGNECIVVLPQAGPLEALLRGSGAYEVLTLDVLKVRSSLTGLRAISWARVKAARRAVRDAVARLGPAEVVHSNTTAVLLGAVVARDLGVPHVWTVREMLTSRPLIGRAASRILTQYADVVTYNSAATRRYWERCGPSKLRSIGQVIYNALPACEPVERDSPTSSTVTLALIGRINGWKGHVELVEAVGLLSPAVRDRVKVLLVGEAPEGQEQYRADLERRISQTEYASIFTLTGFVEDIGAIFARTDVVVTPSQRPEPYGRVPVEAAFAGLPTIATEAGGFTETIIDGETGVLVPIGNTGRLAMAISELVENGELRETLGQAARERALATHSTRAMADAYLEAYGRAMGTASCYVH